jgi:uncharacterized protein
VLIHRGQWYAYDPNANEVCGVGAEEAALLSGEASLLAGLDCGAIESAHREILKANAAGLFLDVPAPRLVTCGACHAPQQYDDGLSHLTLTLTEACSLRCRYCPHTHAALDWQRRHSNRRMSSEVMAGALRYFLPRCTGAEVAAVSFYGGEPLLEFALIREAVDIIEAEAPRDDVRVIIDTNGLGLAVPEVRELIVDRRLHLQVSLDGPAEVHDRYRVGADGAPSHARVLDGIRELLALDRSVARRIRFQATVVDAADLPRIGEWFADFPPFREAGLDEEPSVGVNLADLRGLGDGAQWFDREMITSRPAVLADYRQRYLSARTEGEEPDLAAKALFDPDLVRFYHRSRAPQGETATLTAFCVAGKRRLHVTTRGAFQPCERVGTGLCIGNVDDGIDPVAAAALVERFVAEMGGRCRACWASRLCTLCATSLADGGGIPESVCEGVRGSREEMLCLWIDLVEAGAGAMDFLKGSRLS